MPESQWDNTFNELREALVSGSDSDGVEFEAEEVDNFGSATLVTVVESSAGDAETQVEAYKAVCELLDTRLNSGADQVLGCLVIDGDPDPDALLTGLDHMLRDDGTFTPVLPLSAEQAKDMVASGIALLDIVDPATALLEVAASRSPLTHDVAATALEEIDELIARDTSAQ